MVYAVIMAGGGGTRFWPESRRNRPKQLLKIVSDRTMIRATVDRILPSIPAERVMVVTGHAHSDQIKIELPDLEEGMIVIEPIGCNTAPCIALAAHKIRRVEPDATMVVLPADDLIQREAEFRNAINAAVEICTQTQCLLTFGIIPTRPETGYGYIELGDCQLELKSFKAHSVANFIEKPDRPTAESYFSSGRHMWNSGMFVWRVADIITAFEKYLPKLNKSLEQATTFFDSDEEASAIRQAYETIDPISIDYGIMEKADNVLCLPIDVDWNDVGSWTAIQDVWEQDEAGNALRGEILALNTYDCVVSSPHRLITLLGVEDLIVVDTPDALLICRKDRAQDVKTLQAILKDSGYGHVL